MRTLPFALAPLALALPLTTLADGTEPKPAEIVITANRSPGAADSRLDAATVITRADIERLQPNSLATLLSQTAGISVPTQGGPLSLTGTFLRGFKSNQVLVLVDGVRINDANQGSVDLSLIRPDDIERIEVVRGGYSSQYGSDAMGGVIQIFTRQQDGTTLSYRGGSYQTEELGLSFGMSAGQTRATAAVSQFDTAGFNATNSRIGFPTSSDRDGGRQRTARVGIEQTLDNGADVSVRTLLKDSKSEFDDGVSQRTFALVDARYKQHVTASYQHQLDVSWQRNQIDTPAFDDRFETLRTAIDWVHSLDSKRWGNTAAGLAFSDERAISEPLSGGSTFDKRLGNSSVFLVNSQQSGRWTTRLSGRHDEHETYGSHTTGSLRLGYEVSKRLQLNGGFGNSFRAPTANELYYPGFFGFFAGNPNLHPEQSRQADIGASWQITDAHRVQASVYRSMVSDLISFSGTNFQAINVAKARLQGLELTLDGHFGKTAYQLSGTRAEAEDENGNALLRRPRGLMTGNLSRPLGHGLSAGIQFNARSRVSDTSGYNGGYAAWHGYASWQASRHLTLGLRLENLFDKSYEEIRGYNTPGRSGYVTAQYRF